MTKRAPRTVNNALAAVDDFYTRTGLGPATAARAALPRTTPRALTRRAAVKFLREVERWPSPRDAALALVPFYAGARIAETVGLDVDDVALSARKGTLRIHGKGDHVRSVPIHPPLRAALTGWLDERGDWPGSDLLSLHPTTAARWTTQAGGTWHRYAADLARDRNHQP
ncbi:tyrosine recombinase XerC [Frankia sp. CiP3]|uniref:site-specific integrase n=1 Tax=Frankia sp. CiP3 TaxID=2880971 RepID=UPI001EF4696D|nr:tyrosine-type recombinase/integrase [Frankia sp. CiP3]